MGPISFSSLIFTLSPLLVIFAWNLYTIVLSTSSAISRFWLFLLQNLQSGQSAFYLQSFFLCFEHDNICTYIENRFSSDFNDVAVFQMKLKLA